MKYYNCLVVLGIAICVVFAGWSAFEIWDKRDGPCIRGSNKEVPFGHIGELGQTWLYYHGTYEYSGGKCLYPVRVTEAEYERQMYKVNR